MAFFNIVIRAQQQITTATATTTFSSPSFICRRQRRLVAHTHTHTSDFFFCHFHAQSTLQANRLLCVYSACGGGFGACARFACGPYFQSLSLTHSLSLLPALSRAHSLCVYVCYHSDTLCLCLFTRACLPSSSCLFIISLLSLSHFARCALTLTHRLNVCVCVLSSGKLRALSYSLALAAILRSEKVLRVCYCFVISYSVR